jgi:phytoene synthase
MDTYTTFAYAASRNLTLTYSTSFGISSRLFSKSIRRHIYAIYGLVRIADEIVDTYPGTDRRQQLDSFEAETYIAIRSGYSTNPIIHAFSLTVREYGIKKKLITAFFKSMRMDLDPKVYTETLYKTYIYGSAEVIGLMCLRIFCDKDETLYSSLESGAKALGAAYQKINFLRDLAADYKQLGRLYFPGLTFDSFNDKTKQTIIKDIRKDIALASDSLMRLPKSSRIAVSTSLAYYLKLLDKLAQLPANEIKKKRVRINNTHKLLLLGSALLHERGTK